jgi:hypothetical protein
MRQTANLVLATVIVMSGCSAEPSVDASTSTVTNLTTEVSPTSSTGDTTTVLAASSTTTHHNTTTPTMPELHQATGVVIAVVGNLQGTDSFTILLPDGSELVLLPEPDLLFDGGPLAHLRDHLTSGAPIVVTYTVDKDGNNNAHSAGDA